VVAVSAREPSGLDALRAALERVAAGLPGRAAGGGPARLHVDRSFTLRGIGTVVTGTLWSGEIRGGDTVTLLPRGLAARVRSVQVHDEPVARAEAGQRVALALAGVGWREVARGDVVCADAEPLRPTYLVDARLELEPGARPLRRGVRVHVHHGTREAPARVHPLEDEDLRPGSPTYAQLRLEAPLVPAPGDRFVLRQLAPPDTVGGGAVIDPRPRKHGRGEETVARLRALERGEEPPPAAGDTARSIAVAGPTAPALDDVAGPTAPALDDAALRIAALLRSDGERPRADADLAAAVGLAPADSAERLRALERTGQAVRVGRGLHFHPEPLEALTARLLAICERDGQATIAGVRDELGTSRRYAQALLEHLDAEKLTLRRGDAHVLRRSAQRGR